MLSQKIIDRLNQQINLEIYSSHPPKSPKFGGLAVILASPELSVGHAGVSPAYPTTLLGVGGRNHVLNQQRQNYQRLFRYFPMIIFKPSWGRLIEPV